MSQTTSGAGKAFPGHHCSGFPPGWYGSAWAVPVASPKPARPTPADTNTVVANPTIPRFIDLRLFLRELRRLKNRAVRFIVGSRANNVSRHLRLETEGWLWPFRMFDRKPSCWFWIWTWRNHRNRSRIPLPSWLRPKGGSETPLAKTAPRRSGARPPHPSTPTSRPQWKLSAEIQRCDP